MNKNKICFVLLYNHNYEANITKLEKIYGDKFSHIFHLMPFYNNNKENVIPVYQSSYFFCDFIRQGLPRFYDASFTHYVFCADDLILNPRLNENNIISQLCQEDQNAGFITEYDLLGNESWYWMLPVLKALLCNKGCHFLDFLPSYEEACKKIESHGLSSKGIPEDYARKVLKKAKNANDDNYALKMKDSDYKKIKKKMLSSDSKSIYPLVHGFSDFFILPANKMKQMCQYFGIFSSGSVFVEAALPTSMLLCLDKVYSLKDTNFHTSVLWGEDRIKLLEKYNSDFNTFYKDFVEDLLYVHPVKLSQWRMEK